MSSNPVHDARKASASLGDGGMASATVDFSMATTDDVGGAEADFLRGRLHQRQGQRRAAIEHLARAAASCPPHVAATSELAAMLIAGGYKREAISLLERVAPRLPSSEREVLAAMRRDRAERLTVVSIHQPSYLPWLGFLHKIYYADTFVILDDVKYSKNSFIKRALVRKRATDNETTYLSIPLKKHSDFAKINELAAAADVDWRSEHLRKIAGAYRGAPFFKDLFPGLEGVYGRLRNDASLAEVTGTLLTHFLGLLRIERPIVYSSTLSEFPPGQDAHERNMALVRALGGTVYLSGAVARDYQQGKAVPDGLSLIYQDMWGFLERTPYLPRERFVNGLSAVDALFAVGPEAIVALFQQYENPLISRDHLFNEQPVAGAPASEPPADAAASGRR